MLSWILSLDYTYMIFGQPEFLDMTLLSPEIWARFLVNLIGDSRKFILIIQMEPGFSFQRSASVFHRSS